MLKCTMSFEPRSPEGQESPVVSVVLATLNERVNIAPLLAELFALDLPPLEIIVVDDGSVDGTREYVQSVMYHDRRVRLICHEGRQTLITAQLQGIQTALGRFIVIMDADLQHPPEIVPLIVRALQSGETLVIASRYDGGGGVGKRSAYRAVLSRGAEAMARVALPSARLVTDPLSGFFGFRRELARPLDSATHGFKLLLFLLVMSQGKGIKEIGYQFRPRIAGSSKITHNLNFLRTFSTELIMAKRLDLWRKSGRSGGSIVPAASPSEAGVRRVSLSGDSRP